MIEQATATLVPMDDPARTEREWRDLEERSDGSFFLSWLWLGTLLDHLPGHLMPDVFRLDGPTGILSMAFVFRAHGLWRGTVPVTSINLNATGLDAYDRIYSEYNSLLWDRTLDEQSRIGSVRQLLQQVGRWDQFSLAGVPATLVVQMARQAGAAVDVRDRKWTYQADLGRGEADLARHFGGNARAMLRRSQRYYAARGPLALAVASDTGTALTYFDELVALHQSSWRSRGKPGAFSSPWVLGFHRDVIARGASSGTVCITRVTAGGSAIGVLYNIRWRSRVLNYQSGFAYEEDRDARPGMVAHYLAMEHARANGASCYDFLAGANQLKLGFGQLGQELMWCSLRRDRLLYCADRLGRRARQFLTSQCTTATEGRRRP